MSAYQLSNEKFQKIGNWLYYQAMSKNEPHFYTMRTFLGLKGMELHEAGEELVKSLVRSKIRDYYNLNRLALVTRYGEPYDREDNTQFPPQIPIDFVEDREAITWLQCLHYQCSEYITGNTKMHESLGHLISELCENIFNKQDRQKGWGQ